MINKGQFECHINENEKINIIVEYDIKANFINVTNVSMKDDALVLLSDLSEKLQSYILNETNRYFRNLKDDSNKEFLDEDVFDGVICAVCNMKLKPNQVVFKRDGMKHNMPENGDAIHTDVICESCKLN